MTTHIKPGLVHESAEQSATCEQTRTGCPLDGMLLGAKVEHRRQEVDDSVSRPIFVAEQIIKSA
jgi:hypothetical protein